MLNGNHWTGIAPLSEAARTTSFFKLKQKLELHGLMFLKSVKGKAPLPSEFH